MSKIGMIAGAAALALVGTAGAAQAQEFRTKQAGDLVIGLGMIGVLPENIHGPVDTIGGKLRASNAFTGQVDFTYFLNPISSLNLIAASTEHDLSVKGSALGASANLGKIWVLPPTLTIQYHPLPDSRISPYVGAGLNYSLFYGYSSSGANAAIRHVAVNNGFGFALNAGVDIALTGPWGLNLDVKKIFLSPNAAVGTNVSGVKVHARTDLNPLVVGASVRYRFSL